MNIPSSLADACPRCFPGDAPAAFPLFTHYVHGGGLCAHYCCTVCRARWRTGWDAGASGWPLSREEAA